VYLSDYEHNAIRRRNSNGEIETLAHDPRILWPDTLSLAADGYLYFIANQIERQPPFHNGSDLRQKPYVLFRFKMDGTRIRH
jgi:sugar lactone lactonase YvrE